MLDYFGDLGGLVNALRNFCTIVITPLAVHAVDREVIHSIFALKEHKKMNGQNSNKGRQDT